MGLRERNAAKTRLLISQSAATLFSERGYEATTMEDVAHRADVGTSTLYRYFPTKESLFLAPLGESGAMARELSRRPADEPIEVALGHSVIHLLGEAASDTRWAGGVRQMIAEHPRLQTQLLAWWHEEQAHLQEAIADRLGTTPDDVHVAAAAWMAIFVLQRSSELSRGSKDGDIVALARGIMTELSQISVLLPRLD